MRYLLLFLLLALFSCTTQTLPQDEEATLQLVATYPVNVSEPSGLTYDSSTKNLWTISDNNGNLYKLDTLGTVLEEYQTHFNDPEGIAYDYQTNSLWITEEATSNLINVSKSGEILSVTNLDWVSPSNSGLEGICINHNSRICVIKEKNPSYFYVLDSELHLSKQFQLNFSGDCSGIFEDEKIGYYWLVSDQDETLYLWDEENNKVEQQFKLNFPKAEGIVYITSTKTFYIVSDSQRKLFKFRLVEG